MTREEAITIYHLIREECKLHKEDCSDCPLYYEADNLKGCMAEQAPVSMWDGDNL